MIKMNLAQGLIVAAITVWSLLWKCYSVWVASKNNHKGWFVALIILNTAGILDMIYIFGIAKKKLSDIQRLVEKTKIKF